MSGRYSGPERRADYGWHLRKEINLGHMLTTVALLAGLAATWSQLNVRISLMEDRIARQAEVDARQDVHSREAFARVDTRLTAIDEKLEKLVQYQMRWFSIHRDSDAR